MKPLIREIRKGGVVMPALISVAGKETAVLISRRPISAGRKKLLKEQMARTSGIKYIEASCEFKENALTFTVQSPWLSPSMSTPACRTT